jgi:hypothetical protein
MPKRYELDLFDDAGEHLASLTVYGADDSEIDTKLEGLGAALKRIDEMMDRDQAFATMEVCEEDEVPILEAGDDEEDEDECDEEEEDEEDGE